MTLNSGRLGMGIIGLLISTGWLHAADPDLQNWALLKRMQPKGYVCHRAATPIKIDGQLDDSAWTAAPWTDDFQDIQGGARPAPRFRTRAKMLWDEEFFYIAAELEEPHVWGTLTKRDSVIFQDNDFEVFIDPNGDNLEYYEFEMNALNTVWDLFLPKPYKDLGKANDAWDIAGLRTAVHVDGTLNRSNDADRGWTLEIAFPWRALAAYARCVCPPRDGDQWRVDFSRVEWQIDIVDGHYRKRPGLKEDNWIWSPPGIVDMHRPERWGYVQFSTNTTSQALFRADSTLPVRDLLMGLYYAQRSFRAAHGGYASNVADLAVGPLTLGPKAVIPQIAVTEKGYVVSVEAQVGGGVTVRWHVREDSRLWHD